jgi:hypothetical protein
MIPEQRVVHDAESPALAREAQRALELANEADRAQRRNIAADAEREVAGMTRRQRSASRVRVASAKTGLAAGTFASSAPLASKPEVELRLVIAHGSMLTRNRDRCGHFSSGTFS